MVLNYVIWDIDPEIVNIIGISIRWYGVLFASSFLFGYLIFQYFFKKEQIAPELLDSLLMYMMVGTIVGARLGHCFFYDWDYYTKNPWEILMVWQGGLASHGAAIGIVISLSLWCKKVKKNFLWLMDRIAIAVALSGLFIRMGNLFNSEIYGIETTLPWGFVFVLNDETLPKHPTQIYEALSYFIIFVVLLVFYMKNILINMKGKVFGLFLVSLFSARFLIESIKNPQSPFEQDMIFNMGQLLSIPFILVGFFLLIYNFEKNQKIVQ